MSQRRVCPNEMEKRNSFIFISSIVVFIGRINVERFVLDWKERRRNLFMTGRKMEKRFLTERKKKRFVLDWKENGEKILN